MATMGKWGSHSFVVSSKKVNPFGDFSTSAEAKAKDSKSKKKKTELEKPSFSVKCARAAGVDPEAEYFNWRADIGKKNPLYIHGKKWMINKLKLTKVALGSVRLDDLGRFLYAEISLTFEEENKKETYKVSSRATASKSDKKAKKKTKKKKK